MSERYLLVLAHAGLCNRLLPIVSGRRAAERLGRRLIVCWADAPRRTGMPYDDDRAATFDDLFDDELDEVGIDFVNALRDVRWFTDHRGIDPSRWHAPAGFRPHEPRVVVSDVLPDVDDWLVAVRTSRLIGVEGDEPRLGFLHREPVSYPTPPPIVEEVRPWFRQLRPAARFAAELDAFETPDRMLGVHIRKTDFPWRTSADDENERVAEICDRAMTARGADAMFLSTDCAETHEWFQRRYGSALLSHDRAAKFSNDLEGTEQAVVDLWLLARSRWILGTNHSTFSVAAWLLSDDATLDGEWWFD